METNQIKKVSKKMSFCYLGIVERHFLCNRKLLRNVPIT